MALSKHNTGIPVQHGKSTRNTSSNGMEKYLSFLLNMNDWLLRDHCLILFPFVWFRAFSNTLFKNLQSFQRYYVQTLVNSLTGTNYPLANKPVNAKFHCSTASLADDLHWFTIGTCTLSFLAWKPPKTSKNTIKQSKWNERNLVIPSPHYSSSRTWP